jgi:hypothetical protein
MKCPNCGCENSTSIEVKVTDKGITVVTIMTFCDDCKTVLDRETKTLYNN